MSTLRLSRRRPIGDLGHRPGVSPPRRRRGRLAAAGLLVALPLAGCTGATDQASSPAASGAPAAATSSADTGAALSLEAAYQHVIAQVLPSVVEIRSSTGLGSGIVYDADGNIVTNAHVVGSDTRFQVLISTSATPLSATLVGVYPPNDLAVIKIEGGGADLQPATFADSGTLQVGDIVLAMGNPLGLSATVTDGIISALSRTVNEPASPESPTGATLPNTIQTSAAINPGNSGGALVDMDGKVVGIPTLAAVDAQLGGAAPGIGFAIPSSQVTRIADQLVSTGAVTDSGRAALGVRVTTLQDRSGQPQGVGVVDVTSGGAAEQAGIRPSDVIVSVDGQQTPTAQALSTVLAELKVGQQVPVTVQRAGTEQKLTVTLGELGG